MSASPTPRDFTLAEEGTEAKLQVGNEGGEQVSAADYDPSLDRREDEQKRIWNLNHVPGTVEEEEEDVDDMFAINTSEKKVKKVKKVLVRIIYCERTADY
jgi:serine/threonine-protein kinase PRP4